MTILKENCNCYLYFISFFRVNSRKGTYEQCSKRQSETMESKWGLYCPTRLFSTSTSPEGQSRACLPSMWRPDTAVILPSASCLIREGERIYDAQLDSTTCPRSILLCIFHRRTPTNGTITRKQSSYCSNHLLSIKMLMCSMGYKGLLFTGPRCVVLGEF